jgi:hypothetical protein
MYGKYATNASLGATAALLWIVVIVLSIIIASQKATLTKQQDHIGRVESLLGSSIWQSESRLLTLEHKMDRQEGMTSVLMDVVNLDKKKKIQILRVRDFIIQDYPRNHPNGCSMITPGQAIIQAEAVVHMSERYGCGIPLLLALGKQESLFCNRAVSHMRARGWGQLLPETAAEVARDLKKRHLRIDRVRDNIEMAAAYLGQQLITFDGDVRLALAAYNAGPGYVFRVLDGRIAEYPQETQEYIVAVLKFRDVYLKEGL